MTPSLESSFEVFAKGSDFNRRNGILFFNLEHGKNPGCLEIVGQRFRLGDQVKMDVMEMLCFCQTD
jgi:hypothetical protein